MVEQKKIDRLFLTRTIIPNLTLVSTPTAILGISLWNRPFRPLYSFASPLWCAYFHLFGYSSRIRLYHPRNVSGRNIWLFRWCRGKIYFTNCYYVSSISIIPPSCFGCWGAGLWDKERYLGAHTCFMDELRQIQ